MKYRLGLDVGVGSLGWAVVELDNENQPCAVIDIGSRIYGTGRHPRTNSTRASERTQARAARRNRDRYKQRRKNTICALVNAELFPAGSNDQELLTSLNPWRLRSEGIRQEISPHQLGRAIFHLQQRRGFLSNRKADKAIDDKSAMLGAIGKFKQEVGDDHTVGSYLYEQTLRPGGKARARRHGVGAKAEYDFYVDRGMILDEFTRLWKTQHAFHPDLLTDAHYEAVKAAIFFQRPLKPQTPGKCFLEPEELRCPKALPSAQLFRLYQEVNALRVTNLDRTGRPLTESERDTAISYLRSRKRASYAALRNKIFGKGNHKTFSHENGERKNIPGDEIAASLANDKAFGDDWFGMGLEVRDAIVERLMEIESDDDEARIIAHLVAAFDLDDETATHVATKINLPEGHFRLSRKAVGRVLPVLSGWNTSEDQPYTYDQAVLSVGYESHSQRPAGEGLADLPYYGTILQRYTVDVADQDAPTLNSDEGQWGRIGNPTVHIGLNQIRKVVNKLIVKHGPPSEVHVEVARDLSATDDDRQRMSKNRAEGEKRNTSNREELERLGISNSYDSRLRLQLFDELAALGHKCVFSGRPIEKSLLFTNEYQIDHILPYSRTLDDGFLNKILVHQTTNQIKGNRSPYEAFGDSPGNYVWEDILDRSEKLHHGKKWRFSPDAMEQEQTDSGFLARHLNDTRYLARVTKQYLEVLVATEHNNAVVTVPGRLTAMLRHEWGLNSILSDDSLKNRSDHRHHAVDAVIIAMTDRGTVNRLTRAAKSARDGYEVKRLKDFDQPWDGFRNEVAERTNQIVVSHKPEHGIGGRFLEDTAYGIMDGPREKDDKYLVQARNPETGLVKEGWKNVVPVYDKNDPNGEPYKAYIGGSNYCIEIVRLENGKWYGDVVSWYDAYQPEYQQLMASRDLFLKNSRSGLPLVMRLSNNDVVAIGHGEARQLLRLAKTDSAGAMYFVGLTHSLTYEQATVAYKKNSDPLRKLECRRVFVDHVGSVVDPGFRG